MLSQLRRTYNQLCLNGRLSPGHLLFWYRQLYRANRLGRIFVNSGEFRQRRQYARQIDPTLLLSSPNFKTQGFTSVSFRRALLDELLSEAECRLRSLDLNQPATSKNFFYQLLHEADRDFNSPFMRFALDEQILSTIAEYLGTAPFLESISLLYSKPATQTPTSSQMWHKDDTDRAIIKVFVYINNVTPDEGPLTVLPLSESKKIPSYLSHYLTDEQLLRFADAQAIVPLTGERGSVFLVDTNNCFHFGSRCSQPRLAFVAYYTTGFGYFSRVTNYQVQAEAVKDSLSPLQQLALGL